MFLSPLRRFDLLFGILLNLGLALLAMQLHRTPWLTLFSPMIIAISLGILVQNILGVHHIFHPGTRFCLKRILKLSIILMGFRLSLSELQLVGLTGFILVSFTLISNLIFTLWLGKILRVKPKLALLVAAGTSICGASAVVATNAAIEGSDEEMVYAVSLVTAFGTVFMVTYPLLASLLQLSPAAFGLWCGASIHEFAQVVAAAFQNSSVSGELATIFKLARVLFLLPVILVFGIYSMNLNEDTFKRTNSHDENFTNLSIYQLPQKKIWQRLPIPWFVLLFAVLVIVNSTPLVTANFRTAVLDLNQVLLTLSLAAMGLETRLKRLYMTGLKPFYLAAMSSIFLSALSLFLIKGFYGA